MKKIIVYCLLFIVYCFSSCSSGTKKETNERAAMISSIDSLGKKMFDKQTMQFDKNLAFKGISSYDEFVKKFPNDSLSAEYLFRKADLQRGVGDNRGAIITLGDICKKYSTYKNNPECIFFQGYYYQEFFNDTTSAKYYYNELISKYPTNGFVDDAKALMGMFGKSEEQIIKEFEQKQNAQKK